MAHPFFDSILYPWELAEAQVFHVALYGEVAAPETIHNLYNRCGNALIGLKPGLNAEKAWTEVLDLLSRQHVLRNLCDLILRDNNLSNVHAVTLAVRDYEDPIFRPVLRSGVLVVDREQLRANLVDLASQTRKSVLLVRGCGAGKSWTQHLVAEQAQSLNVLYTILFRDMVGTVREVVEHLFDLLGAGDRVPPTDESDIAWYRKVCLKLHTEAARSKTVLWIVVDDIGEYPPPEAPRLHPEIRQFFNQFVVHMSAPQFARWFRLVLLDYPTALPTNWDKDILIEDKPSDQDVDEPSISKFLLKAARHKGKQLSQDKANQMAQDVLTKVKAAATQTPHTPPARLRLINSELDRVYRTL